MTTKIHTAICLAMWLLPLERLHATQPHQTLEKQKKEIAIQEVKIYGQRPLKQTGTQITRIDTLALHDNIASSLADILTFNTPLFVKSYGRATLSTVSFRGTSASHTRVTWNGMPINSPMLGMTDFSTIPSYFIDDASLLHGTSSVNETGGGLGGVVKLSTTPTSQQGFGIQYIQGVGSFYTFDEFLRLSYGSNRWQSSTRVAISTSPNRYKYRNRDKKENIYDQDHHIIDSYHPIEENLSGAFRDVHMLQEIYYNTGRGNKFGLNAWYFDSYRELPTTTVDYGDPRAFENYQREQTLRSVLSWEHLRRNFRFSAKAGYIHSNMSYNYSQDKGTGEMTPMIRSQSRVNTGYGQAEVDLTVGRKWLFTASITANQHFVVSADRSILLPNGRDTIVGYDKARIELSALVSAKWRPTERLGLSVVVRQEFYGTTWAKPTPALFADYLLSKRGNVLLKASVSRNFRVPTLNDLYFKPGGNPELRPESGWNYDAGISFDTGRKGSWRLSGSATWFDSRVDDWIIWLSSSKGYSTPHNIRRVHAYGAELQTSLDAALSQAWKLGINGGFTWSPSINQGDSISAGDRSVGKQLPYIPNYSASLTGNLSFRSWSLLYKWCYYSERYTMSSNDTTITGHLPPYFMSNITLEKRFTLYWADLSLKGIVNNLFDEEYLSVLSRPMPGVNYEFFIGIKPRWGKKK